MTASRNLGPMRALPLAALLVALAVAVPASASLVEDTLAPTGLTYQEDAGVHGDAVDTCVEAEALRSVALGSTQTANMLVEEDDESDAFVLELTQADVGQRVALDLLAGILVDRYDIAFDVQAPGCDGSVFDPDSSYYDQPPAEPYTPPLGSAAFEAGLTGYACDGSEWKFLANQMGGLPAPATIYVEWTDGSYEYVPVAKSTPATIAMYRTPSHLDVTVSRAVIVLPATYSGQFNLVHGPCDAVQGTPDAPPAQTPRHGDFTVQEAGTHVIVVSIVRGTVEKTADAVGALAADPPTTVPASCHRDVCSLALGDASYGLGAAYA